MEGAVLESLGGFSSFSIFHRRLGCKDEAASMSEQTEKLLYFFPPLMPLQGQLKHVEMCEGLIDFTKTFQRHEKGIEMFDRNKRRYYFLECEPEVWMVLSLVKEHISLSVGGYPRSTEATNVAPAVEATGVGSSLFTTAVPYSGPPVAVPSKGPHYSSDAIPSPVVRGLMLGLWDQARTCTGGVLRVTSNVHARAFHARLMQLRARLRKAQDKRERLDANAAYRQEQIRPPAATSSVPVCSAGGGTPGGTFSRHAHSQAGPEEEEIRGAIDERLLNSLLSVASSFSPTAALRRVLRDSLDFSLFYTDWSLMSPLDAPPAVRYHPQSKDLDVLLHSYIGNMAGKHPALSHVAVLFDGYCIAGRNTPGLRTAYVHLRAHAFHALKGQFEPDRRDFDTCCVGLAGLPLISAHASGALESRSRAGTRDVAGGAGSSTGGSSSSPLVSLSSAASALNLQATGESSSMESVRGLRHMAGAGVGVGMGGVPRVTSSSSLSPQPMNTGNTPARQGVPSGFRHSETIDGVGARSACMWSGPVRMDAPEEVLVTALLRSFTESELYVLAQVSAHSAEGVKHGEESKQALGVAWEEVVDVLGIPLLQSALVRIGGLLEGRRVAASPMSVATDTSYGVGGAPLSPFSPLVAGEASPMAHVKPTLSLPGSTLTGSILRLSPSLPASVAPLQNNEQRTSALRRERTRTGTGTPVSVGIGVGGKESPAGTTRSPLPQQAGGSGKDTLQAFIKAARPSRLAVPSLPAAASAASCLRGPVRVPSDWPTQTLPYVSEAFMHSLGPLITALGGHIECEPGTASGRPESAVWWCSSSALHDTGEQGSTGNAATSKVPVGAKPGAAQAQTSACLYLPPVFLHAPGVPAHERIRPTHRLVWLQESLFSVLCWVDAEHLSQPADQVGPAQKYGEGQAQCIPDLDPARLASLLYGLQQVTAAYLVAIEPQTSAWFDAIATAAKDVGVEDCPVVGWHSSLATLDVHGVESITRAPGRAKRASALLSQARPTTSAAVASTLPHGLLTALAGMREAVGGVVHHSVVRPLIRHALGTATPSGTPILGRAGGGDASPGDSVREGDGTGSAGRQTLADELVSACRVEASSSSSRSRLLFADLCTANGLAPSTGSRGGARGALNGAVAGADAGDGAAADRAVRRLHLDLEDGDVHEAPLPVPGGEEHLLATRHSGAVAARRTGERVIYLLVPPGPATKKLTSDGRELDGHVETHMSDLLGRAKRLQSLLKEGGS